ncbi:glycosyl transferase [Oleiphilus sp. HI0118]|nr:glycosyl transferase [Oleiphilus sp. HI0118]KZZ44180.1 glycosyl transferase [Oleiphilus sp. HI0118]KZZ80519.1 glycosyl transferase [Oleiphilus sp. HI0133]
MTFLFWIAVFGTLYSYFIYPIALKLLATEPSNASASALAGNKSTTPNRASFIITAHNEGAKIAKKIENTLSLDQNGLELEIIVASDCSTDDTDDIVKSYQDRGVTLVRADQHLGKEYAQLCAIKAANHDVLIFSDTATELKGNVLQKLMAYFTNDNVGAISSEDRFITADGKVAGEGAYVKYEMWLRGKESSYRGLVGLSGSFFAARKEICSDWDIHSPSDFNTALNAAKAGKRAISCPDVEGYYPNLKDESKEYQRKLRTAIRGMTGLSRHTEVLSPSKFGMFAFQVWSHKVMRWAVPWFMLLALVSNAFLLNHWFYQLSFAIQLAMAGAFISAHFLPALRQNGVIKLVYFFYQVNFALAHAAIKFFSGTRMTTWKPSAR